MGGYVMNIIKYWNQADFLISTDKEKIDLETVHQFLKTSYWANERLLEEIIISVKNSLCFGMYEHGTQIGFARVVSDYSTFAWLADVFILPSHQKQGLGKWLLDSIFTMEELSLIKTWILLTNDAQELYAKVGFVEFPYPERVMIKNARLLSRNRISVE